nr:uncharacterized protein LOC107453094 isoform X2 [Parasteatoda tepidariorum]
MARKNIMIATLFPKTLLTVKEFPMNFGGWKHEPFNPYNLTTAPSSGIFHYQTNQSYRNSYPGVVEHVHREAKISPDYYEVSESRNITQSPRRMNNPNGILNGVKRNSPKKPKAKAVKSTDNSPSAKVKMEIYLEKFDTGVFVTKVKVGNRVRWQDVKYEKQALRYHPAIKRFQTVMSAIDVMKNYKTLHISLTKEEAERYKAGVLLEGVSKPKSQSKQGITCSQVNNYIQVNNFYNAGPSTSTRCIEDDYGEPDSSDYSTE